MNLADIMKTVPNNDARRMQPLPWRLEVDGQALSLVSVSKKLLLSFWGSDTRHPQNYVWPTDSQRKLHAEYIHHVVNIFPEMQEAMAELYEMPDMPEHIKELIGKFMERAYYENIPPKMIGGK